MRARTFIALLAWLIPICFGTTAFATDSGIGYVQYVSLQPLPAGTAVFTVSTQPTTGWPTCASTQRYAININTPAGQALYSTVLTAMKTHSTLFVHGSGVCDVWPDSESIVYLNAFP